MKKILRLLKRRKNGGFTLVEVIVSCALLGILIMAVVGMITPVMSVVMRNEKNANALMIAEGMEAYIDRNIKNSVYCAVFTNAIFGDLTTTIDQHDAVKEMKDFLNEGDNKNIYDLKIMGIRWEQDSKTHLMKYMVKNIRLNYDDSFNLKTTAIYHTAVFEECFYDNLYPDVTFEVMAYNEKADDGTITATRNVALKTVIDVYSNQGMTALAAQGKGYADFINIRTPAINRGDIYKLYSIEGGNDAMGNPIAISTQLRTDSEMEDYKAANLNTNAETYIFYVTRKLKYVEPPTTP